MTIKEVVWNVSAATNNLYYTTQDDTRSNWNLDHGNPNSGGMKGLGFDIDALEEDPLFVDDNPSVGNDFSLQSNSPAIDAGVDLNPSIDYIDFLIKFNINLKTSR